MKTIILILFLSTIQLNVFSCDCYWGGSFTNSVNNADIILTAKIISYDIFKVANDTSFATLMKIEVIEIVALKDSCFNVRDFVIKRKYFNIIGNTGSKCSPYISNFPIGTEWIFKLNKAKSNFFSIDFTVSNCATNYLLIDNGIVKGNLFGKNQKYLSDALYQEMKLRKFIAHIKKIDNE